MDRPSQTTGEQFLITKRCGFGERIHWFRVDRRSIRFQTYRDLCGQASLNHWKAVLITKRFGFGERIHWFRVDRRPIRFQNYSCGRSLKFKTLYLKSYQRYVREQVASSSSQEGFHF